MADQLTKMCTKMFLSIFIVALAVFPTESKKNEIHITPNTENLFIQEGASVTLDCSLNISKSEASDEQLTWKIPSKEGVDHGAKMDDVGGTRMYHKSISIPHFAAVNYGEYKCSYKLKNKQQEVIGELENSVIIKRIEETRTEPTFEKNDEVGMLSCSLSKKAVLLNWYKNNTLVSELDESDQFVVVPENNTLIIKSPMRKFADVYIARFDINESSIPYDCKVEYRASPLVLNFDKSKNLIQEEKLELHCKVLGYPRAKVTWKKDGETVNATNDDRVQLMYLDGYENAKLTIKSVGFDDAGDYKCIASSAAFVNESSEKTITVRVKDKLAALWPFLGIVGEVIVLCTIIFIYEKRRNKQAEQEEDTTQEADGNASDKKEGLRHRNTNNPSV